MARGGIRRLAGMMAMIGIAAATAVLPLGQPGRTAPSLPDAQRALANARHQAEAARARSAALEARAGRAAAEADIARDRAAAMAARIQETEADVRAGEARIAIIAALQTRQAQRLAEKRAPIARLIAGLQAIARHPPLLALLQPGPISDAVHLRILLSHAMPEIARRTAGLRTELARSRALRQAAENARTAMVAMRAQLTDRRAQLARMEAERRIASLRLHDSAAAEAERALAMGESARDIVDLMDQIEDAATVRAALEALPGPVLRPRQPGETPLPVATAPAARAGNVTYRMPVVGDVVTGFGELAETGVRSRGVTLATAPGATVVAPANGRIAFAGPFRDYANIVIIDHGSGWTSLLTHLRRLNVRVGDTVRLGDPLGNAGNGSGTVGRARITIELRRDDRPVDVAALMR